MKDTLQRAILGILFAGAVALLAFNLLRAPRTAFSGTVRSSSAMSTGVPISEIPKTDRPADVGNAAGEEFLRKVERPAAVPSSGRISIGDETFSAAYDELYDHRDKYYGREVELSGYVMGQDGLGANEFLVGRDLLWCCESDKYFIGFLVKSALPLPRIDATVIVRGTLEPTEYRNPDTGKTFTVPAVRAARIDPIDGISRVVYPN